MVGGQPTQISVVLTSSAAIPSQHRQLGDIPRQRLCLRSPCGRQCVMEIDPHPALGVVGGHRGRSVFPPDPNHRLLPRAARTGHPDHIIKTPIPASGWVGARRIHQPCPRLATRTRGFRRQRKRFAGLAGETPLQPNTGLRDDPQGRQGAVLLRGVRRTLDFRNWIRGSFGRPHEAPGHDGQAGQSPRIVALHC